mmetsp:Transcript_13031/g.26713  ORF Transcript_13031/g.26713 Transcript_13031/m.26713 type:complete len:281 (-) Transcript_13031:255-1097(-)
MFMALRFWLSLIALLSSSSFFLFSSLRLSTLRSLESSSANWSDWSLERRSSSARSMSRFMRAARAMRMEARRSSVASSVPPDLASGSGSTWSVSPPPSENFSILRRNSSALTCSSFLDACTAASLSAFFFATIFSLCLRRCIALAAMSASVSSAWAAASRCCRLCSARASWFLRKASSACFLREAISSWSSLTGLGEAMEGAPPPRGPRAGRGLKVLRVVGPSSSLKSPLSLSFFFFFSFFSFFFFFFFLRNPREPPVKVTSSLIFGKVAISVCACSYVC